MITIKGLHVSIEGRDILKGIDLHVRPGDIYGLLGPNGAGKSTTIFALLGLREYESGHISVLGYDPKNHGAILRRSIGVMPEHAGFYDWMTATAYLRWYGRFYQCPSTSSKVEELLEKVGLKGEGQIPISGYSRGMKQRLAIARALLPRPRLLILDEPTNGLDPKGRREIHDLLTDYARDGSTAVLLSTHLLDDVDRLCNRIGIMDQGCSRYEGSLMDLLTQGKGSVRYRLHLESEPDAVVMPAGMDLLGRDGDWWQVEIQLKASEGPSSYWRELWRRGWPILEIRSEVSSLESFYLDTVAPSHLQLRETV